MANFWQMLRPHLGNDYSFLYPVQVKNILMKLLVLFYTLCRFVWRMLFGSYDLVLLNPSLGRTAVKRDMIYAFLAKRVFRKKLMIFWHGWNLNYEKTIDAQMIARFHQTLFKADKMFVLASTFEKTLRKWGYSNPVQRICTCYSDTCPAEKGETTPERPIQLLFLSRVEIAKGIMELLDAFKILLQRYGESAVELTVAGDGNALNDVKKYVEDHAITNVKFTGYVRGKDKDEVLRDSDIFILPSYGEGMPCALLEAMGAGDAVITSKVGGIPDFFEEEKMGYMLESVTAEEIAGAIGKFLNRPELIRQTGRYNRAYAVQNFTAQKVVENLQYHLGN